MDALRCSQNFSMSGEWTKAKVLKFLKLFSSEPILWDLSHKHQKLKRKIVEAWKRISVNLNNTPIVELKRRKKNLITRYRSLAKKQKTDSEAGYDEEVYQPSWFAFELMDSFLGSSSHEDPLQLDDEELGNPKTLIVPDDKTNDVEVVGNSLLLEVKRGNNSDNESIQTNETICHNDMLNCGSSHNIDISKNDYEDDDECDLYARLLAKKLKRYSVEKRHRLMYTIDGILLDNPYPKDNKVKF